MHYFYDKNMIAVNSVRTDILIDALTTLCKVLVRATHRFLTEDNIQKITPFVNIWLLGVENLIVKYGNYKPVAFMGIDMGKIKNAFYFA